MTTNTTTRAPPNKIPAYRVGRAPTRNFGYGRQLAYAGVQATRAHFAGGRHATTKTYGDRWRLFVHWCRHVHPELNDARRIDRDLVAQYADYLRGKLAQGMSKNTAVNRLSAVNCVLAAMRGDGRVRLSPSKALGVTRAGARTRAPDGHDAGTLTRFRATLHERGEQRMLAVLDLARACGMRLREAVQADLPRLQREAAKLGRINIQDGTKGGRRGAHAPRWITATPAVMAALAQAANVKPTGSRNLLAPDESYKQFINGPVQRARRLFRQHDGLKGFHELRAAYACERYEQLTGHVAPVLGGLLAQTDPAADRAARAVISVELGHQRIEVVAKYIGGRRP